MIKLNHPYECRHCGKAYVIVQGYRMNSFLPVEIINGDEVNDLEFNKEKHTSHLYNCKKLRKQWEMVKKTIISERKLQLKILVG